MRYPILVILIILNFCLQAQEPFYIIYDVKDGLPSSEVYDLEMDDNDNIWFTTDRGVVKYDGYSFQTYTTDDGLVCNTNFEIFKDNKGHFWFSGYDGSLSCYNGQSFIKSPLSDTLQTISGNKWLMQLIQNDAGKYMFHFRVSSPRETQGKHYVYDPESDELTSVKSDSENEFEVFSSERGENFIYDSSIKEYTNIGLLINDTLRLYCIDKTIIHNRAKNRDLTVPMANYNSVIKEVKDGKIIGQMETNSSIRKLYYDKANQLILLCTSDDLILIPYSPEKEILKQKSVSILKNVSVTSIKTDPEGNTWVTSTNSGVIFIPSLQIKSIRQSLLKDKKIFSLNPIGNFMLFNDDKGYVYCYKNNDQLKTLLKSPENAHLRLMGNEDKLYFTNLSQIYEQDGMIKIDHSNKVKPNYSLHGIQLKNRDYLYGERDFSILDHEGAMVYSTQTCNSGFKKKMTAIFQDHNEKIWIGTLNGLYTISDYQYSDHIYLADSIPGLSSRISNFYPDGNKGLWISTMGSGIYYYNFIQDKFYNINTKHGIHSNISHCLYQENDSTLWVGSNKGLEQLNFSFENDKTTITNYFHLNSTDGLGSNYIYDIKKWKNDLWIAHEKGVDYFDPKSISIPTCAPSIKFDSISIEGFDIYQDSITSLDYVQNDISFHFTGISFRKPIEKPFYRYALVSKKQDTIWHYTDNRSVPYTNLKPGNYSFIVSARNKYDNWSELPAVYQFSISQVFTNTIWFMLIIMSSVVGAMYLIYKYREKSILAKEEQKSKLHATEFKLKSAELEALRNQMNPHFIYNTLNSIQNFIFKNEPEIANYFLSSFSKLMRKSLEMSRLNYIQIDQEIDFLSNYIELEQLRFKDKFTYNFILAKEVDSTWKIPPLLLQPIIENTIKHGFKNIKHKGAIEIEIIKVYDFLRILIRDNGMGIKEVIFSEQYDPNKSFGLQIVQNRIQIINEQLDNKICKMSFENNNKTIPSRGIIVTLDLPIVE